MRLADAWRPDEQHSLVGGDEAGRGELHQTGAGDLRVEGEVEVGQLLDGHDSGLLEPACEESIGATGQLVAHQQLEELHRIERAALGLLHAQGQCLGHAGQSQMS